MEILVIVLIIVLLGIIVVLRKGFNEIIKGLESIDERLKEHDNNPH